MRILQLSALAIALAAAVLVARVGFATGGDPLAPLPGSLDELLAAALRANPEILVAEARAAEAQAELNQTRLAVTQQVVRLHFERQEQRDVIGFQGQALAHARQLHEVGTTTDQEVRAESIALAQSEGDLARIEAELRYAIGLGGATAGAITSGWAGGATPPIEEPAPIPPPPVPDAIARVLDGVMVKVEFEETPLAEVCDFLAQAAGIDILIGPGLREEQLTVTLRLRKETSLRKVIHAIADLTDVHFACREYGLLAVWPHDRPADCALVPERREE